MLRSHAPKLERTPGMWLQSIWLFKMDTALRRLLRCTPKLEIVKTFIDELINSGRNPY